MKAITFLPLLFGVLLLPVKAFGQDHTVAKLAPDAVAAVLAEGALFVDVRETNEVEVLAYDLPGVINLPLSALPERLAELPRDRAIILAGRTGKRSVKAAALLGENDFTQLYYLDGGIIAWEAAELLVKRIDRSAIPATNAPMQCCSSKADKETAGKSCCAKKTDAASAKTSCGEKGKAKGKSCCSGGTR